jgi:hypothetical protein
MNTMNEPFEAAETKQGLPKPKTDTLAKRWQSRLDAAQRHWRKLHERIRHNRKQVAGFDWTKEADSDDFYTLRANLIFSTMAAILPHIYARNPEISVTPLYPQQNLKRLCHTLQTVVNRALLDAHLKKRAKAAVWAAMTGYFGVVKVMYQRDIKQDPIITNRMHDTQDHIARIEGLIAKLEDPQAVAEQETVRATLQQTLASLQEQVDVVAAEGLVLDRVLTENLLLDPSVAEFWDYENADWMAQRVPIKRSDAEALYQVDLSGATGYRAANVLGGANRDPLSTVPLDEDDAEDMQICLIEIWDKTSERVYTLAEGCDFFVREPYSPAKVGSRWYPFFLLPFATVDGSFVAPCLVDLTEKLQKEHNETRDKFVAHRELNKPHWLVAADADEKTIKRHQNAALGEVVLVNSQGVPLNQIVQPAPGIPIQPADYDTGPIRMDWEQVTGLQDASRSTIAQAKTATEASIMQQALSGRVSEFRDKIEDWLQEIAQYAAQILLQELTPTQVERVMGPAVARVEMRSGTPVEVEEPSYDWPELSREQVFDMVQLEIRAGTTGAPDSAEQQENWIKVFPVIKELIMQLVQAQGGASGPLEALLRETVRRFDERLDIEQFLPQAAALQVAGASQIPQDLPIQGLPPQGGLAGGSLAGGSPQQMNFPMNGV